MRQAGEALGERVTEEKEQHRPGQIKRPRVGRLPQEKERRRGHEGQRRADREERDGGDRERASGQVPVRRARVAGIDVPIDEPVERHRRRPRRDHAEQNAEQIDLAKRLLAPRQRRTQERKRQGKDGMRKANQFEQFPQRGKHGEGCCRKKPTEEKPRRGELCSQAYYLFLIE